MKKAISILLTMAMLLGGTALAAATPGTGKIDQQAAPDATGDAVVTIAPEVAVMNPGRITLNISWVQPTISLSSKTQQDTAKTEYYYLKDAVDVAFTLNNDSQAGSAQTPGEKYFDGKLGVYAEITPRAEGDTTSNAVALDANGVKGIKGALSALKGGTGDPISKTAPLILVSKTDYDKMPQVDQANNAYTDNKSFKFTYSWDTTYVANDTEDLSSKALFKSNLTAEDKESLKAKLTFHVIGQSATVPTDTPEPQA